MQCLKAPRILRKNAQTSGASDCWGNLSIVSRENARACGFLHEVVLCKKHYDVQKNFNKSNCCYPFRSGACKGTLVKCPHRLFSVFDFFESHTGTLICEEHLHLVDTDERICQQRRYIPPKKV